MSGRFWAFFVAGLAVVGVAIYLLLEGTRSAHLDLTGDVLKVRVLPVGPAASIVVADFRVTNPSAIPFVVEAVEVLLDPPAGETRSGAVVSKQQMDVVFQGLKLIGPKYNEILGMQDRVGPGETVDRMAAARFEVPAGVVESRKGLRMRIEDVDGTVAEIGEKAPAR
jgi:hypothetical protein